MARMCAPATGCALSSFARRASAGGQLEHPSEVKSSTTTGADGEVAPGASGEPLCFAAGKGKSEESTTAPRAVSCSFMGKTPVVRNGAYDAAGRKRCPDRA